MSRSWLKCVSSNQEILGFDPNSDFFFSGQQQDPTVSV